MFFCFGLRVGNSQNAVRKEYELVGNALKYIGTVSVCPITKMDEVSYEEFRKVVDKGNAKRDRELEEKMRLAE